MHIKYKLERYGETISEITVVKETEHFVTTQHKSTWEKRGYFERKEKKDGTIFDTWEEAKKMLVTLRRGELASAESRVESARTALANAEALTPRDMKKLSQ